MYKYIIGIICAIMGGMVNFLGQIFQKKAINDIKQENKAVLIRNLIKKPIWIIGFILIIAISGVLLIIAQMLIGPALIPGLISSGFIVLAIGSVKILHEEIRKEEIIAICLLIVGIIFISMSKLYIEPQLLRFNDKNFLIRLTSFTILFTILALVLFYGGRKLKSKRAIVMALGSAFPFILLNIWTQPVFMSIQGIIDGKYLQLSIKLLIISFTLLVIFNVMGFIHFNKTLAEGNAGIIIPFSQIPQQLSPIIIYFFIYNLKTPSSLSYLYLILSILLIIFSGFILTKRQSKIEDIS